MLAEQTLVDAGILRSACVHTYIRQFNDRLASYAETAAVQRFRTRPTNLAWAR